MRRDYLTLDVRTGPGKPSVTVAFDGPADLIEGRLTDDVGVPLPAGRIDVTYRLLGDSVAAGEDGVFALTNRVTGEFLLECNADAGEVAKLVEAARDYRSTDAEGCYHLTVSVNDRTALSHDSATILVYDSEGTLLRSHSLIPSGVEL